MTKKRFVILLSLLLFTFVFCLAIRHFKPKTSHPSSLENFPLQKAGWLGQKDNVARYIIDLLKPEKIFSATYTNASGSKINLLFDYFVNGGPHSPRNCLPGTGWVILNTEKREIKLEGQIIKAGRLYLRLKESYQVMDFWYITRYGETANDYMFKLYQMFGSLTFKPTDVAFIRIVADGDKEGLQALDDFEQVFVKEIYSHLPFD
jgi:EpsI family protein